MSERVDEAIRFAVSAHTGQRRKSETIPYILHPMEVAAIVGQLTDDEDVIIAALLHDVVEDTPTTPERVREQFGDAVAELVRGETENKRPELPAAETWRLRKEESLRYLEQSGDRRLQILWMGDKLANMRSLYRNWRNSGDAAFDIFHQKDKREQEWYYRRVAECLRGLADTAAYEEYLRLVDTVFG